jgi:hypothetical protein
MVDFQTFRYSTLRFLERCYPSDGVYDSRAWESSGENHILSPQGRTFIVPEAQRNVVCKTLRERMAHNDWAFASTPGGCESLEGGHSALETLYFYGELDALSEDNKKAWVEYFNQYQDRETGYYLGPYVRDRNHRSWQDGAVNTHPWQHMHDHLVSCLCPSLMLLNGTSRFKLSEGSMTGRFLQRGYLEEYLWGRDWNNYCFDLNFRRHNPWWMGNEYWYPACILWQIGVWEAGSAAARTARILLDEVWYRWHDENMGVTGFWYGDLRGDKSRLWCGGLPQGSEPQNIETPEEFYWAAVQIMGGAHQLWFYDYDHHPIPDHLRRRQTDILLGLQNRRDRRFGLVGPDDEKGSNSNNCTDVDCMTLLAMNYHRQNYRRDDIVRALHDAAISILENKLNRFGVLESRVDEDFTHNFNSYETFSPAGWGNVHNQSFYLWALRAAFSVVRQSSNAQLQSFLDYNWRQVPGHWLWVPQSKS